MRRSPAPAFSDLSSSSADSLTSADSATDSDSDRGDGRQRQRRPSKDAAQQSVQHHSSRRAPRAQPRASRQSRSSAARTGEKRKHGSSASSSSRRKKRLSPQKDRGGRNRRQTSPLEDDEEDEERNGSSRFSAGRGDSEGEEKLEDEEEEEEALTASISRAPSLNAPALLSRPRYLSIVVQDLQHILLPELDAAVIAAADSASSASAAPPLSPLLSAALTGIQHAAGNHSFRRYCAAQLFYSHIDAAYLQHSEFTDCFQLMTAAQLTAAVPTQPQPLPASSLSLSFFESSPGCVSLSSPLCRLVRRRLGRPRRFSPAFVRDERSKLSEFRSYSRVQQRGQQQLQPPPFLPEAVQRRSVRWRLIQGQDVVAVHPSTGEMHEGVVVGYGAERVELVHNALFHCYRVRFRRTELGSALVEDEQIMTDSRTQTSASSDAIENSGQQQRSPASVAPCASLLTPACCACVSAAVGGHAGGRRDALEREGEAAVASLQPRHRQQHRSPVLPACSRPRLSPARRPPHRRRAEAAGPQEPARQRAGEHEPLLPAAALDGQHRDARCRSASVRRLRCALRRLRAQLRLDGDPAGEDEPEPGRRADALHAPAGHSAAEQRAARPAADGRAGGRQAAAGVARLLAHSVSLPAPQQRFSGRRLLLLLLAVAIPAARAAVAARPAALPAARAHSGPRAAVTRAAGAGGGRRAAAGLVGRRGAGQRGGGGTAAATRRGCT